VTLFDWIAIALVVLLAIAGYFRGLVTAVLSLAGVVGGALLGARIAPHVLSGGETSRYTPLFALAGAAFFAIVLEAVGSYVGSLLRSSVRLKALRKVDSAGGFLLGGATGLALVWVLGTVALLIPGQTSLRRDAQRSYIVRRLNEILPPSEVLNALARIDPILAINGPLALVAPPDPNVIRDPGVREAARSVVRVLGTACGLGIAGSGWVARPGLVVTAAHVVAGERATTVESPGGLPLDAHAVAFDSRNDIAVLRVPGLSARPLPIAAPREGAPVAIVGYPENGPLAATPGRVGQTARIATDDAYGEGPVSRFVTSLRGRIRHGNSGGPAVDSGGAVQVTVFAARADSSGGFGVPARVVRSVLSRARGTVSTGPCSR
jgi:S1-C subfamily serine protease